jgi:hypothetical protein
MIHGKLPGCQCLRPPAFDPELRVSLETTHSPPMSSRSALLLLKHQLLFRIILLALCVASTAKLTCGIKPEDVTECQVGAGLHSESGASNAARMRQRSTAKRKCGQRTRITTHTQLSVLHNGLFNPPCLAVAPDILALIACHRLPSCCLMPRSRV